MPGFMVFNEDLDAFKCVSAEQLGKTVLALSEYTKTGTDPEIEDPIVLLCYNVMKNKVKQQEKKYASRVEAGRKGGEANASNFKQTEANGSKQEQTEANELTKTKNEIVSIGDCKGEENAPDGADNTHKRGKFEPPTLEEAQAYAREKGMDMDVEKFMAFYETNGWKVGRNPMKNWHSAMVYWHKNNSQRAREPTRYVPPAPSNRGLEDWDR